MRRRQRAKSRQVKNREGATLARNAMPTTGRNLVLRELTDYDSSAAEMVQLIALSRGPGAVLNCKIVCINTRLNDGSDAQFPSL